MGTWRDSKNGYPVYTHDFHSACNVALYLRYELTLMHPDMDFMIINMKGI